MKVNWEVVLSGDGTYWWHADTPIGPVVADHSESKPYGQRWSAYWHPFDQDEAREFGSFKTEGEAKKAGEKAIRAVAAKLRRALK